MAGNPQFLGNNLLTNHNDMPSAWDKAQQHNAINLSNDHSASRPWSTVSKLITADDRSLTSSSASTSVHPMNMNSSGMQDTSLFPPTSAMHSATPYMYTPSCSATGKQPQVVPGYSHGNMTGIQNGSNTQAQPQPPVSMSLIPQQNQMFSQQQYIAPQHFAIQTQSFSPQVPNFAPPQHFTNPTPNFLPQEAKSPGIDNAGCAASFGITPQTASTTTQITGYDTQLNTSLQAISAVSQNSGYDDYFSSGQHVTSSNAYPLINKYAPKFVSGESQANGLYSGGVSSMQKQFSKMDISTTRFIDLMQERNLLKSEKDDIENILPPTLCNPDAHCDSSIFRSTLGSVPQTQELLKKSRLPFGLTLQPFRDMKVLNVIQTSTIVRCRYCRTYINPYIYLPDSRHWKCNMCFRVNDLPDDFSWDPSTKSFGDPARRPEIRNSTIEFIAPSEYMLRAPQAAVYVFILDVSQNALESGYLNTFAEQFLVAFDQIPGDERTLIAFIAIDSSVHFFQFLKKKVRQLVVEEFNDMFLPVAEGLLINMRQNSETIRTFVQNLPTLYEANTSTSCSVGAALSAAHKLIAEVGGRVTLFLTTLPNTGPGALVSREDPNQRASEDVRHLCPAIDYYKRLALECTSRQISVDLFLLSSQYADLSTLADISKFSSGCIYYFPNYNMKRELVQVKRFQKQLNRYLIRKIGFEAVLRIRCTKGLSLHTFYGNFFVRSADLLAMANVNPDSAIGAQVHFEDNLTGMNAVCFQAAILYTSSKGDRRIRIHTLCLPITKDLQTVYNHFDVKCAVSILSKMAAHRSLSGGSLNDSREAMVNAVVDAFSAYNSAIAQVSQTGAILSPTTSIRLFPIFILGMLKHCAFTSGRCIKLDNRVSALLLFRTASLEMIGLEIYPALYLLNHFDQCEDDPPRLHLSFAFIDRNGVYLLDTGSYIYIYISVNVESSIVKRLFDVNSFSEIDEEAPFEPLNNILSERVHNFIRKLGPCRCLFAPIILIREDGPLRELFAVRMVDDRTESSHSYIEFMNHIRQEMQK